MAFSSSQHQQQPGATDQYNYHGCYAKKNAIKKDIACRLHCRFKNGDDPIPDYTDEHSYVIDFDDVVDKQELQRMFRNSFSDFEEKFDFRKPGTVLQHEKLRPMDETVIDLETVLPLLK